MPSELWGPEIAAVYDATSTEMFDPAVLTPTVEVLFDLAGGGTVLELAVGTGRVALALAARGLSVSGIDLSPHMIDQLKAKPGSASVSVTVGDMATARVPGTFRLVYLVFNAVMNVTTQDEQTRVFANAAAHLEPGGCFVVEVVVPQVSKVPAGELGQVFAMTDDHVGIDTFDDPVGQTCWSHHWMNVDGRLVRHSAPFRYVWPSELDLMAQMAGLALKERWAEWGRSPFTADSASQVVVYHKPG